MARRKKRAWNMSNPLYRYLHSKKRAKSPQKGVKMARRRRYFSRARTRSYARRGGNILMNGLVGSKIPGGLIGKMVAGFVIGKYVNPMLPQVLPSQDLIAPAAVGGLPAVAGKVIGDMVMGSGSTSSGGIVYY